MEDKRITTEYTEDDDGDPIVKVFIDGEQHYWWPNYANTEYPEDLTWERMIAEVFYAGVEAGKKIAT